VDVTDLVEAAPAKVNLYLHVVGRRDDGYHLLDSLAVFPDIGDELRASVSVTADLTLAIEGAFAGALAGEADNLVLRAARALAGTAGVRAAARLVLTKRLPVASGIGGGSADAAAALRVLARLWDVAVPPGVPARLGADVPVCLAGRPARMTGIGEILDPVPDLPACGMVLVNPGVSVATPAIFRARAGDFSPMAEMPSGWQDAAALVAWLGGLRNDLEPPARELCPPIGDVLAALRDTPRCLLARMSGSGATCYGLFGEISEAVRAAGLLAGRGWWTWGGALCGTGLLSRTAAGLPPRVQQT
jgi:4-diphosphocytidyl-2-C-methyl-D-erythritol kinase